jgi:signal transduction histidine kinase
MITIRRALLFVCVLLVTGPLVLFWAWPQSHVLDRRIEEARDQHLLVARTLSKALERYRTDLISAVSQVELFGSHALSAQTVSRASLSSVHVRHISLVEPASGQRIHGIDGSAKAPLTAIDRDQLDRLTKLTGVPGLHMTGVSLDADNLPVLHAVRSLGSHLMVATIATSYISDLGRSIKFGVGGRAIIVDQFGQTLSVPETTSLSVAQDLSAAPVVQRMIAGEAGVTTFAGPMFGTPMLAGFTSVAGAGWGVIIAQPVAELLQTANSVRDQMATVFSVGLILAALIAIRAGIIITAPLERLNEIARRMSDGNLDVLVEPCHRFAPTELRTLTGTFTEMAQKLSIANRQRAELQLRAEKANEAKSDFVRTVTHELRSPVNAIIGFSELLIGRNSATIAPDVREAYLSDINVGGRHLLSLVNDLLDLARAESGQYQLIEDVFWLDEITRRATRYCETQARERQISLYSVFEGDPPAIFGDERVLFQSLLNLITNAVRYGRSGGTIRIDVSEPTHRGISIVVTDDGPGIAQEDLGRVMRPFERAINPQAPSVRGSGLGLPIVRQFIELHGGTFELLSVVGEGTRARIILPASRIRQNDDPVAACHGVVAKAA